VSDDEPRQPGGLFSTQDVMASLHNQIKQAVASGVREATAEHRPVRSAPTIAMKLATNAKAFWTAVILPPLLLLGGAVKYHNDTVQEVHVFEQERCAQDSQFLKEQFTRCLTEDWDAESSEGTRAMEILER